MKRLFGAMIGLLLIGCHSQHHIKNADDNDMDGQRFVITHTHHDEYIDLKKRSQSYRGKQNRQTAQDGAPTGPVPTVFQKVIPKHEPISRYGNPDSYQVMGKRYDVMTNSTGYKSRGIASWYGTKFHKIRTSSGEKYDMYALTAAHKTLPLPTYVRVKNLENGKTAIVKVNDRGPFHESRILDLSYAAAAKLGVFPKGTAYVEVEALKTTQQSLNYFVQAGAFESSVLAESLKTKLGMITTSPVNIQKHDNRYLVQVGPFASRDMVNHLKEQLENNQIHGAFTMLM